MEATSSHLVIPAAATSLLVALLLYNVYQALFGPLAHLPGPAISKFSGLPLKYQTVRGLRCLYLEELHEKYGPIVRVSPTEVSVSELGATKEIHKAGGGYLKSDFYHKFVNTKPLTVFTTIDTATHSKYRRLLAPTMSESALKNLEPVVQANVDLWLSQMQKERNAEGHIDVFKWLHFLATDVIGELSFGESFHMLQIAKNNEYMERVIENGKLGMMRTLFFNRTQSEMPTWPIWPFSVLHENATKLSSYAEESIGRYERHTLLNPDDHKPMFFSRLMGDKGHEAGMSREEITLQAQGFLVAGTDTTAVTGTYMIWAIAKNPAVKAKLLKAIEHLPERPSNNELRQVPYLDHILDETLRLYGAVPSPMPRVMPKGGRVLGGHFIPEDITVSPVAWVLHRDSSIYAKPKEWIPERWENPTKEMKDASFAFGGGARVCLGIHLAKMELRSAVVGFFKRFPDATVAYGDGGFGDGDMEQREFFLVKPKGGRCLIK